MRDRDKNGSEMFISFVNTMTFISAYIYIKKKHNFSISVRHIYEQIIFN